MIHVQNLRKEYGSKVAVNNMSIDVEKGSLFSLLGVNGAGKTTTIKMLTGLEKITSGDATIMGYSVKNEINKVKEIVNVSTQETSVAQNLSVIENLMFIAGIYGIDKKEAEKRAERIIETFHMDDVRNAKAKTLSGGWQRKLSIAMALITNPKVLFLDEPTLGLDVLARRELWRVIEELKGNITIILTTHYMEEAESLSDKIAIMVDGNIKAAGTLDELKSLTNKSNLEEVFVEIATR